MGRLAMVLFLVLAVPFVFAACGGDDDDDGGGKSGLGESCTKTDDCQSGLKCVDQECVQDESASDGDDSTADGDDSNTDGDSSISGTWTDSSSGLTWQNPPADRSIVWDDAKDYCANLSLDGHSDWRLPTISELRSLIRGCSNTETGGSCTIQDDGCLSSDCRRNCGGCSDSDGPADGCHWPDEMEGWCSSYWSSSPVEDGGSDAWHVGFNGGYVGYGIVDSNVFVRCVR